VLFVKVIAQRYRCHCGKSFGCAKSPGYLRGTLHGVPQGVRVALPAYEGPENKEAHSGEPAMSPALEACRKYSDLGGEL
jgi:hypothetical protein